MRGMQRKGRQRGRGRRWRVGMLKAILGCAVLVLRWAMVGRLWGVWRVVVLELALAPVACGGVDSGFGVCSVVGGGRVRFFCGGMLCSALL